MKQDSRAVDAGVLAVAVTALVFLAIIAYPRQWSLGMLINDEFWYAHLARSLFEGNGYVSNVIYPLQAATADGFPVPEPMKQPGYQLLGAALWTITGESVRALIVVAMLGLVAFAAGIFALARRLGWSPGVSAFVAGATVAHPVMAQYGVQVLPESVYFACFIFTLLFILRGKTTDLVAAGVLNAALMVIKGHGLIYIPVFAAFLWLRGSSSLKEALQPSTEKLRSVGTYVATGFATLLIMSVVLPAGSVQLFEAGGTYSQGMLIEVGRATSNVPYLSVDPPPAWDYIVEHPDQYLGKVARMVKRTKLMIETLAGPAMGGIVFPMLLLSSFLLVVGLIAPGRLLPDNDSSGGAEPYLLFVALLGWALLFFWPIYLSARFIIHMLPLMILVCLYVGRRILDAVGRPPETIARVIAIAAVAYFVAYPAAATMWDSYREPDKLMGSMLAVRFLDYDEMAATIEATLPDDAVVISDMPHEIVWLTRRKAIHSPNGEDDLDYLIEKFDVDAIYEHPQLRRDWPRIVNDFDLVDSANGFLWVRRRGDN